MQIYFMEMLGKGECLSKYFTKICLHPLHLFPVQSHSLTLSSWVKISVDDILKYFSYFSQKLGFDILCKFSPYKTICMKYQILFSGKNKKNQFVVY